MPQISKKFLNKAVEKRLFEVFEQAFLNLKSVAEAREFLNDLLTPTEKIMIAKRLAIAVLVEKGYDYRAIIRILKVSFTTINAVLKQQTIDGRGYHRIVDKILRKESLDKFYLELSKGFAKITNPHPASRRRTEAHYQKEAARRRKSAL